MVDQSNPHPATGFWFGFALGTLSLGAGLMLFGTKKGRKTVQQLLEFTENFEENAFVVLEQVQERAEEFAPLIKEEFLKPHVTPPKSGIGGLLNRIKSFSPTFDKQKKYTKSSP